MPGKALRKQRWDWCSTRLVWKIAVLLRTAYDWSILNNAEMLMWFHSLLCF